MSTPNSTPKFPEWNPVGVIRPEHAEIYARLFRIRFPDLATRCNGRVAKAVQIMSRAGARRLDRATGLYEVESDSGHGWYQVDLERKSCTCPDAAQGNLCKHRLAIGLQIVGHDWLLEWQLDHSHRCHSLRMQVDEAWDRSNQFATIYEDTDPNAPELERRRELMLVSTRNASDLQLRWNALIQATP